jgi:hypothetical protein
MRTRLMALFFFAVTASIMLSLIQGQERPPSSEKTKVATKGTTPLPAVETPTRAAAPLAPSRDLSRLSDLQKQHLMAALRGADWLYRKHGVKGKFQPGYLPALARVTEGDSIFRQAGAAAALARAARFCGEERYAARATQAILALLEDTTPDARDSMSRHTSLPNNMVNRLGSAGALVLAIHLLPTPQVDLLDRGEELCRYISRQTRKDGGLDYQEANAGTEDEGINHHPGLALAAVAHSQKRRPASWKIDLLRKALPVYRARWKGHHSTDFVSTQSPAWAEAFMLTKEKAFADFVFEMNDWVCTLQYTGIDPRRKEWYGGFKSVQDGKAVDSDPNANGAALAEGLVEGCRVARELGDLERYQRYTDAIERCLQFLSMLQYTNARTQHFAPWFRDEILGAFHASPQDGNLRLDYTRHAVGALLGYLEHVAR